MPSKMAAYHAAGNTSINKQERGFAVDSASLQSLVLQSTVILEVNKSSCF